MSRVRDVREVLPNSTLSAEINRLAAMRRARSATNALGRGDALWEAERWKQRREELNGR